MTRNRSNTIVLRIRVYTVITALTEQIASLRLNVSYEVAAFHQFAIVNGSR